VTARTRFPGAACGVAVPAASPAGWASAAGALLGALLAVAPAHAQQQCESDALRHSMSASRFQDHGDGTVTDLASRRMWTKCVVGQNGGVAGCQGSGTALSWPAAQEAATELNRSGRLFFNDWRLPALPELAAITERACSNPRTNLAVFPATPAALHWTSTSQPGANDVTRVYALSFGADGVLLVDKGAQAYVRFVRTAF
jgi:hypothetical protein